MAKNGPKVLCPPWLEFFLKLTCPFSVSCHADMPRETPTHAKYIWRNLHGFQTGYLHTMTANLRTARGVHSEIEVLHARIGFCTPITRAKVGAHAEDLPEIAGDLAEVAGDLPAPPTEPKPAAPPDCRGRPLAQSRRRRRRRPDGPPPAALGYGQTAR